MSESVKIFLCGCPRSGTTYLRELFAAHPKLKRFVPETGLFAPQGIPTLLKPIGKASTFERFEDFFWRHIYKKDVPWLKPEYDGVSTHLKEQESREILERFKYRYISEREFLPAIRDFVMDLLPHEGYTGFVEKTPMHCLHIEEIRKVFPDAIIVYIERDSELVAKSIQAKPWGGNTFEVCLEHVENMKYIAETQSKEIDVRISLEELVRDVKCIRKAFLFDLQGFESVVNKWIEINNPGLALGTSKEGIRVC